MFKSAKSFFGLTKENEDLFFARKVAVGAKTSDKCLGLNQRSEEP